MTESHNGQSSSAENGENPEQLPDMKYKLPKNVVKALDRARKALLLKASLDSEEVGKIREDLEWLMNEHSQKFDGGKRRDVKVALRNLREEHKIEDALGSVKMVRREFEGVSQ